MVLLINSASVTVLHDHLRNAQQVAQKADQKGFTLACKLLPVVFSLEELAQSRGQGIKTKDGDLRQVLDQVKMNVVKVMHYLVI